MQVVDGTVHFAPSDITAAAQCEFAWLRKLDKALRRIAELPKDDDAMGKRVSELGDVHEQRQLDSYKAEFGAHGVATIDKPDMRDPEEIAAACEATLEALRARTPIVFQAALRDGDLRGFADFLALNDAGEYVVQDTKLARKAKVTALLQIAAYADILEKHGIPVSSTGVLILGDGRQSEHDLSAIVPVYRLRRRELAALTERHLASDGPVAWNDPDVSACGRCVVCAEEVVAHDDLLLVARLTTTQRDRLRKAGITTIRELAESTGPLSGINPRTLDKLRHQAQLQLLQADDGKVHFKVFDPTAIDLLPAPSPGDIFFDFEGDPLWQDPATMTWGLEYLFGVVEADTGEFVHFWADDRKQERAALREFLDYVAERRKRWPDMHIYHYAPYERTALLRLAAQFGEGEDEIDGLLRQQALVDLYPVVTSSIRHSQNSYGLKALEALFLEGKREGAVTNAGDSVVEYENYLLAVQDGDTARADKLRQDILDYNEQDCDSTRLLRDWLLDRRTGSAPAAAIAAPEGEASTAGEESDVAAPLFALAGDVKRSPLQQAFALLAAAVGYHRRENKPYWWGHYDRVAQDPDVWADARDSLVITSCEVVNDWHLPERKRNKRRTLQVKGVLQSGATLERDREAYVLYDAPHPPGHDPSAGAPLGTRSWKKVSLRLLEQDEEVTTFEVVETLAKDCDQFAQTPMALTPTEGPRAHPLPQAIRAIAERTCVMEDLVGPLANLLLREPPRLTHGELPSVVGDDFVTAITDAALRLDSSTLAVQGPPGTGKTYTAARVIAALVNDHGWRVGVVSQGHSAVNHLLDGVVEAGVDPERVGKKDKPQDSLWTEVDTKRAVAFLSAHAGTGCVYGGTSWDFANESRVADGQLDLLVIDEAGQFSLANTIAVSRSCQRMILFGDPQQLPQVSQGQHPEPVNESALGWLTHEAVLPPELGYFLSTTRRMHPDLCQAVSLHSYEGKLEAHESAKQRGMWCAGFEVAPGVAVSPVCHTGNSVASPEEAAEIVRQVESFLNCEWQEEPGCAPRPMTPQDVLVVAPYNAQVDLIRRSLAAHGIEGVQVGTVDKFQGREAPVVLVSMSASAYEDVPRGMEFLISPNRINVAVSRAQWRTVIVHSRALLDYLPTRPEVLEDFGRFVRMLEDPLD